MQLILQGCQRRRVALIPALNIRLLNILDAPVYDRTVLRLEIAAHDLLEQGQDKFGLVR